MNLDNIQITTLGWQAPNWKQEFYPEDMPEEWQLDYYLNYFSVLACPMPIWAEIFADQDKLDEFSDCLFESSRVFCVLKIEIDAQGALSLNQCREALEAKLTLLNATKAQAPWLTGVVVNIEGVAEQKAEELQVASVYQTLRQSLDASLALSLLIRTTTEQECAALALSQFPKSETSQKPIWYACNDSWLTVGSPLGWMLELPADGKKQAEWLQKFYAQLPREAKGAPIIIAGDEQPIDMAQVKNLKVVAELLGF